MEFLNDKHEFYFIGEIHGSPICDSASCARAYLLWRSKVSDVVADQVLQRVSSEDSGFDDADFRQRILVDSFDWSGLIQQDTSAEDDGAHGDSKMNDNSQQNNQQNKPKTKKKTGVQKRIIELLRRGKSFGDIAGYSDLVTELFRNERMYKSCEIYCLSKRAPIRRYSNKITPQLLTKYIKEINTRSIAFRFTDSKEDKEKVERYDRRGRRTARKGLRVFSSWYNYNFTSRPLVESSDDNGVALRNKGKKLLWLWSAESSIGKTTVYKEGLMKCGQIEMELSFQKGWCESFRPKSATFLVVDGVNDHILKDGLTIQIIESLGNGFPTELSKRYVTPPKTSGEPVIFTSNSHAEALFGKTRYDQVIVNRMKSVHLKTPYLTGFDLTNLVRETNNVPKLNDPDTDSSAEADFGDDVEWL